jgi:oxalate decarboxylase/phosphoglucose isomerase-like protein (cupin superfamily)
MLSKAGTNHNLVNETDEPLRVMVVWGEPGSADLSGFTTVQHAKAARAAQVS